MTKALEARVDRLEERTVEHSHGIAEIGGKLDAIKDVLDSLNKTSTQADWMKKAMIGAIIVQSVLYGITTPDAAKSAIAAMLGGH